MLLIYTYYGYAVLQSYWMSWTPGLNGFALILSGFGSHFSVIDLIVPVPPLYIYISTQSIQTYGLRLQNWQRLQFNKVRSKNTSWTHAQEA